MVGGKEKVWFKLEREGECVVGIRGKEKEWQVEYGRRRSDW